MSSRTPSSRPTTTAASSRRTHRAPIPCACSSPRRTRFPSMALRATSCGHSVCRCCYCLALGLWLANAQRRPVANASGTHPLPRQGAGSQDAHHSGAQPLAKWRCMRGSTDAPPSAVRPRLRARRSRCGAQACAPGMLARTDSLLCRSSPSRTASLSTSGQPQQTLRTVPRRNCATTSCWPLLHERSPDAMPHVITHASASSE
jgi:hypothetical protein